MNVTCSLSGSFAEESFAVRCCVSRWWLAGGLLVARTPCGSLFLGVRLLTHRAGGASAVSMPRVHQFQLPTKHQNAQSLMFRKHYNEYGVLDGINILCLSFLALSTHPEISDHVQGDPFTPRWAAAAQPTKSIAFSFSETSHFLAHHEAKCLLKAPRGHRARGQQEPGVLSQTL